MAATRVDSPISTSTHSVEVQAGKTEAVKASPAKMEFKERKPEDLKPEDLKSEERKPLPFVGQINASAYRLNHVRINNVSRALKGQLGLSLHGYIAVSASIPKISVPSKFVPKRSYSLKPQWTKTVFYGWSPMHGPIHITSKYVAAVVRSAELLEKTKLIIQKMQGRTFEHVTLFFREVLRARGVSDEEARFLAAQEPYFGHIKSIDQKTKAIELELKKLESQLSQCEAEEAIDSVKHAQLLQIKIDKTKELAILKERKYVPLLWELHGLLSLNMSISEVLGSVFQMSPATPFCLADEKAFDIGTEVTVDPRPELSVSYLYDFMQQQNVFQWYIEDRTKIGFAEEMKSTQPLGMRMVNFVRFPWFNPFEANCNKSTASVLQAVEDAAAEAERRETKNITGASYLSYGSNQRMFFWNTPFHRLVVDWFINDELKPDDPRCTTKFYPKKLQQLADNKDYIFKVIESWPLGQQMRALEQLLNPSTPLGKVALTPKSSAWGFLSDEKEFLRQVGLKLNAVIKSQEVEDEFSEEYVMVSPP